MIHEGDEGSKLYFDFFLSKGTLEKVLGIHRADEFLVEYAIEILGMFSDHFQAIFSPYSLSDGTFSTHDACCRVVPRKVSTSNMDRLE